ncbi:MAG: hypothetical protein ACREQY_19025, partial [Candidatus Binatia bacterium]
SQSGAWSERPRPGRRSRICVWLLASLAVVALRSVAASEETPSGDAGGPGIFGADSALGRIEYHPGRGLRVGDTGLTVGGFATAEAEGLEGGESRGGVEGVNHFLFLDPVPFVHLFTELEVARLAESESGRDGVRSDPAVEVDRLYADVAASDALNVRFGKFLTPIGQWNQAPAEPLVWTTSEPLIVEEVFDESVTGAMAWGAAFRRGGALSYSFYGTFLDPIAPDRDAPPAEHSAGARLEWASLGGWTVGASYFASEAREREWNHLGGADVLWQPPGRVELSGEAAFGEGTREEGALWGLYAQAVIEMLPTLYAVGRYERFDPPGSGRAVDLFDVGLAWVPVYYLRLKADYRFADHFDDLAAPGFRSSLSVLF